MEQKKTEFNKVFNAWDILVIAFGAMIGWGWVVSSGGWIQKGGVLGAAIGFVQQPCHSVVVSMCSVTGQWARMVPLSVHGQSSWDMSELPALKHVHFQRF